MYMSKIEIFFFTARDPRFELFRGDCVTGVFDLCLNYLPFGNLATVSLKVVSRKRRRKCTLKSYDRFTNS